MKKIEEITWDQWMAMKRKEVERDLQAEVGITPQPLPYGVKVK